MASRNPYPTAAAFMPDALTITALREGVEIILILTMLITLAAKAGQAAALRAIGWGVGMAVAASLATALGLNWMVASSQGWPMQPRKVSVEPAAPLRRARTMPSRPSESTRAGRLTLTPMRKKPGP